MSDELTQYEILAEYECLHNGWELDNEGYIAKKKDGSIVVLESDHGVFQEYTGDEAVKKLNDWLQMYSDTMMSVRDAMRTFIEETRNAVDRNV